MTGLSVAVVGAGIGGLAAALALAADGHDVTVVEKRTGFAEAGAGIQLSPNAVKALRAVGVSPPRGAVELNGVTIRSIRSGRRLAEVALGSAMRERYGAPYLVAARSDLHTSLLDAARGRAGIRLLVGRAAVGLRDEGGRVGLTLAGSGDSRTEAEFDLVVGADGLGSAVRRLLGNTTPVRPSGFLAARAVLPAASLPDGIATDRTGLWWGAGRHVVHYPIEGGRSLNVVAVLRGAVAGSGWSEPIEREQLQACFADACPPLRQLMTVPETWTAWALADAGATSLAGRRVALLGDAAHPVLPYAAQGGALALEDAAVLADALRRHSEPRTAVVAYTKARLPRVRRVQIEARRNGRVFHLGGPAALARDLALRLRPPAPNRSDWLYGWEPPRA